MTIIKQCANDFVVKFLFVLFWNIFWTVGNIKYNWMFSNRASDLVCYSLEKRLYTHGMSTFEESLWAKGWFYIYIYVMWTVVKRRKRELCEKRENETRNKIQPLTISLRDKSCQVTLLTTGFIYYFIFIYLFFIII